MKIRIPQLTTVKLGRIFFKLMQLSALVNKSKDNCIVLNFENTRFINAVFLSGIYSLSETWRLEGRTVEYININPPIANYLNTVHFNNGFNLLSHPNLVNNLAHFSDKTYTPLVLFPAHALWGGEVAREISVDTILNLIKAQVNPNAACEQALSYLIAELANNVAEHSECQCGLIYAQTYKADGFIDIIIADTGIGIFKSFEKTDKFNPETEQEAINFALNGRSTKDQAISRGFGLPTSRSLVVKALGGTFLLWSGETIFIQTGDTENILKVEKNALFKGCFISIRLKLNEDRDFNIYDYIES